MPRAVFPRLLPILLVTAACAQPPAADMEPYRPAADRLIQAALADSQAIWERLAEMCDTYGHRFSGSESLERALDWMLEQMRADGLEGVRAQPVLVPHWVRGAESLVLTRPLVRVLPMLGLGGSIATPPAGIRAEVLVVTSRDELDRDRHAARGKIVLFDVPFTTYGETVTYRTNGAVWAAQAGAVASLIRSVTPYSLQTPG
jgi:carboxypeptidase Q